jgi:hypothetical protein
MALPFFFAGFMPHALEEGNCKWLAARGRVGSNVGAGHPAGSAFPFVQRIGASAACWLVTRLNGLGDGMFFFCFPILYFFNYRLL